MLIKTQNPKTIQPFLNQLIFPKPKSHKGQNGKLLIIGGSSLFHAASLWSAAIASRIVDIVHYCSTEENEKIFLALKSKFVDGIIIKKKDLESYVKEDNCVLIGPGMVRRDDKEVINHVSSFNDILSLKDEPSYTYYLTQYLIKNFPHQKFVFDAGALQMMEKQWLLELEEKPILTPHQVEFETLFGIRIKDLKKKEKIRIIRQTAKKFNCFLLVKAVNDIVSDGEEIFEIEGGNAGLTKGGTGDVLAGLIAALNTKNNQLVSAIVGSFLVKKAAEELATTVGFWYNPTDLVYQIPKTAKKYYN